MEIVQQTVNFDRALWIAKGRARLEQLDRLIAAGWEHHPGNKIPAAVARAAADPRATVPLADKREARCYERGYHDAAGKITVAPSKVAKVCVICGAEHRRAAAKTCSKECSERLRDQTVDRLAAAKVVEPTERRCVQCGVVFVAHSQFDLCSDECRKERRLAHSRNEVRVRADSRRKHREMYMQNRPGISGFAGKISTKTLEYKQEDSHVG